jgi:hypothetical protein
LLSIRDGRLESDRRREDIASGEHTRYAGDAAQHIGRAAS